MNEKVKVFGCNDFYTGGKIIAIISLVESFIRTVISLMFLTWSNSFQRGNVERGLLLMADQWRTKPKSFLWFLSRSSPCWDLRNARSTRDVPVGRFDLRNLAEGLQMFPAVDLLSNRHHRLPNLLFHRAGQAQQWRDTPIHGRIRFFTIHLAVSHDLHLPHHLRGLLLVPHHRFVSSHRQPFCDHTRKRFHRVK